MCRGSRTTSSEHLLPSCSRQEGLFPCFVAECGHRWACLPVPGAAAEHHRSGLRGGRQESSLGGLRSAPLSALLVSPSDQKEGGCGKSSHLWLGDWTGPVARPPQREPGLGWRACLCVEHRLRNLMFRTSVCLEGCFSPARQLK